MSDSWTPRPSSPSQQPSLQQHEGERIDIDDDFLEGSLENSYSLQESTSDEIEDFAVMDLADVITFDDGLPASVDPSQPLSASPAMDAALKGIANDAPSSRTRRNARRPADSNNPAEILRQRIDAQRQVASMRAEADMAAAVGQAPEPRPEKRYQPPPISSPTASGKNAKADHPAPGPNAMDFTQAEPAKNRPTSFDHLYKSDNLFCAAVIGTHVNDIMGDPFSAMPGWTMEVNIDPGRLGQPSIGLNFKFSKDGTDSRLAAHYNTFSLSWEPGVRIGGKRVMQGIRVEQATKPSIPQISGICFPPALQELCKKPEDAARLFCLTFKSNVHKTSPMQEEWAAGWDAPYRNLKRMYSGEDPSYRVTLWFMAPTADTEHFNTGCLRPFVAAVQNHTPPSHQNLDERNEPMMQEDVQGQGRGMRFRSLDKTDPAPAGYVKPMNYGRVEEEDEEMVEEEIKEDPEEALKTTEANQVLTLEDRDALRAENLKLQTENTSLQTLLRDQHEKIRKLAHDLRQAYKERDEIVLVAEKTNYQRGMKPRQVQKALNGISKILK